MAIKNLGRVVGKSAYEIWLEKGNTGTEEEFLQSLKGKDGDKGDKGDTGLKGEDGKTPIKGVDYFDGKDGQDGTNGQDGYSPIAKVETTSTGATITITDKNGTTTANITNGKDGANGEDGQDGQNGQDGQDGYSPTAKVTQTDTGATITITDKDGTTTANIINGKDGEDGASGSDGADGYTPVKGIDYWTEEDEQEIKNNVNGYVAEELAKKEQAKPEFVNSIEECVDTDKFYVLPDGYIYAYMYSEKMVGGYTNVIDMSNADDANDPLSFKTKSRLNANCGVASATVADAFVSNVFDCKAGDVLRIKGVTGTDSSTSTAPGFVVARLNESGANITNINNQAFLKEHTGVATVAGQQCWNAYTTDENGVITWTYAINNSGANFANLQGQTGGVKARLAGIATDGLENIIVTVNEEIKEAGIEKVYDWTNTGLAFVPSDYEDRIIELEKDVNTLQKDVTDLKENGINISPTVKSNVNWFAFGDSITQGYVSYIKEDGTASSKYLPNSNQSWVYKVAELNGYNVTNYAVGGTGLAYGNPNAPSTARQQVNAVDFTNCDLVTLAWGCNDWKYNSGPVGSVEDDKDEDTTPCAALKYVIERIQSQNPLCKIIVLTPINVCFWGTFEGNYGLSHSFSKTGTLEEFYNAIVSVCKYYGIEYIDNTHSSIFNRANITSLLLDGVHPTPEAYVVMAKELAKKINFK